MKTLAEIEKDKDKMFVRGLLFGLLVSQKNDIEYIKSWIDTVQVAIAGEDSGEAEELFPGTKKALDKLSITNQDD